MKLSLTTTIAMALIGASATSLAAPVPVPEGISRRAPGRPGGAGLVRSKSDLGSSSRTPVGNNTPGGSHSPPQPASRPSSPPPSGSPSNSMGSAAAGRASQPSYEQQNLDLTKQGLEETKSNNANNYQHQVKHDEATFNETKAQNRKTLALSAVGGTAALGLFGVNAYNSHVQTVQADRANDLASAAPKSSSTASHRRNFIDLYYTN